MFESDDWIFKDTFDVGENEEEARRKSYFPYRNEEETPYVKRRKVDNHETLLMNSTFVQNSELDTTANTKNNDQSCKNKNDVSREDLLLGIFQRTDFPENSRDTFDFAEDIEKDSSEIQREIQCFQSEASTTLKVFQHKKSRQKNDKSTKVKLDKEVKLIRIFPGPAGLVPDVKNDNISATSYLSSVEELENKTSTEHIEIKSQDEKNLSGEKAWKFLLNDLPNNFLQDYKISIIKDRANASHCDSMKIKFIAGILDCVDCSHDDPFVTLKDSTGSIEGTIHRDVPLTYPGILEPNVVILLHDVGLLKTTTYVVTNKYHILVSLVNLLAIYSDKGRIVSTPLMESILSHTSNIELNRINNMLISKKPIYISELQREKIDESHKAPLQNSSFIDSSVKDYEFESAKDVLLDPTNGKYESCEEALKNDKNCEVINEIPKCFNYSMDTNDLDMDVFFAIDRDFTTLEEQNCLNRSLCKSVLQINEIQRCNLQVRNTKHLENTKKESKIHFQKQTQKQHLSQTLQNRCITGVKTCNTCYSCKNFSSCNDATCRNLNLNVKSTLPAIKRNGENSKTLVNYFTDEKCDEFDSDDEILSQLDVANIFDK